jgi:hypothetical protein
MAAGNREYPLASQIVQRMNHLPRLALIVKARGNALGQAQPLITRFEQHRPTVGAGSRLVELPYHGLLQKLSEQNTLLCGSFSHARASVLVHYALLKNVCTRL